MIRGKGSARVYPFLEAQKERTHSEVELCAVKALETRTPQYGVKGPSMLSKISHFDLVDGFVPDFLHCALLGVACQLVSLWFETTNHEHPWYIGQPSTLVTYDARVRNVVVPKEVRRLPCSIKTREHWKANEFKTFVLYYSLVVLQGILPSHYLSHFFLFVWSLHKLLGTNITREDLVKVKAALDLFIVQMEQLYGIGSCTFNVHQLSHLVKSTLMCGPLWAVSTFTFERNNGVLKKMIQGTQYVSEQVCQTYAIMKTLPMLMKQTLNDNENASELLRKLVYGRKETRRAVRLAENLVALSKAKIRDMSEEERLIMALAGTGVVNKVVYEYNRFTWKQKLYDTEHYSRSEKCKNCFIKAFSEGREVCCKIKALVTIKKCNCDIQHHEECHCPKHSVLTCMPLKVVNNRLFRYDNFNISSDFLLEVSESTQSVIVVQLDEVVTKCVKVEHGNRMYVVEMPNMVEME